MASTPILNRPRIMSVSDRQLRLTSLCGRIARRAPREAVGVKAVDGPNEFVADRDSAASVVDLVAFPQVKP